MSYIPPYSPGTHLPELIPPGIPGPLPGRLLGIDVGGSATRVVLVADGMMTAQAVAPPMNALLTPDIAARLGEIIQPSGATAAGISLPGMRSAARAAELAQTLSGEAGIPVYVAGDGTIAWLASFGGNPGIAVHAGTGSGATGCDGASWARAGGHGFLLGDEGSAYWLGRAAVSAALRWEDGTGGSADLHRAVTAAAGSPLAELVRKIHSNPAERSTVTRFAPIVPACANDDEVARSICLEAARHLADLASAVRRRLGPLPVAGLGGVFGSPVIWDSFAELTGAVRPLAPPEVGAALLAGAPLASFIREGGGMFLA
jgi:glucosamine kinase